jgi:hypothetical protein
VLPADLFVRLNSTLSAIANRNQKKYRLWVAGMTSVRRTGTFYTVRREEVFVPRKLKFCCSVDVRCTAFIGIIILQNKDANDEACSFSPSPFFGACAV